MSFNFSELKPNIAVVGKIKDLKIQRKQGIQSILNRVNEVHNTSFTLDDNFHIIGMLENTENLPKILLHLKNEFYPLQVVCGIGIAQATEIDEGIVFSLALEALEVIDNYKHKKEKALSDVVVNAKAEDDLNTLAINTIYKLMYVIEQGWTQKQRSVIHTMLFEEVTQAQVASMYEVSASNVTQMLTNGQYFTYKESLANVEVLLKEVFENTCKNDNKA